MSKLPITPGAISTLLAQIDEIRMVVERMREDTKDAACPNCGGYGWIFDNDFTTARHECSKCKGTGFGRKEVSDDA